MYDLADKFYKIQIQENNEITGREWNKIGQYDDLSTLLVKEGLFKTLKLRRNNMTLMRTNEWITTLAVKDTFSEYPTDEDILKSAKLIVWQLERIQNKFESIIDDNGLDLEIVLYNFSYIIDAIENNTDFRSYDNRDIWRGKTDEFNEYMKMLYDLADSRVRVQGFRGLRDGIYKFIWVK